MDIAAIENLLRSSFSDCDLEVVAEGNRINLVIVSDDFEGLNRVERQRKVYGLLNERIRSGEIHAVSMRTLTRQER